MQETGAYPRCKGPGPSLAAYVLRGPSGYLEQQVVFEDALDWLQQVGAQGQRMLQQLLPVPEELSLLLVPHALRQGGH